MAPVDASAVVADAWPLILERLHRDRADAEDADAALRHAAEIGVLLAALREAQDESAARARVMAAAGHDLRQPLQAAILIIERVRKTSDPALAGRLGEATDVLTRMGGELGHLALASAAAQARPPAPLPVRVSSVLAPLRPVWAEHAGAMGVELRLLPSSVVVRTDAPMLATILSNLVGNAIKYSRRGGRVLVGARRHGPRAKIQVLDEGAGMTEDALARIFAALDTRDGADRPGTGGLGLGLSIVKRTAAALGHELDIRTAPGRGSCFAVLVPVDGD